VQKNLIYFKMGIKKNAKNYEVIVKQKYLCSVGGILQKYADNMIIESIDGNLKLGSNKKIINNGGS